MISFSVDNLNFRTNGEGLSVSVGKQSYYLSKDIIIPSTVVFEGKQYIVNEIDKDAFKDCNDITSVVIPSTVYSIGDHAFAYCINLLSVKIPSSVLLIGNSAFTCCRALLSVTIPSSVTFLGDRIFDHCSALTTVEIHSKVSSIGASTFSFCRALTSLTLPDELLSIGISAFSYCKSLTSIHIPSSVMYVGDSAFEHCTNIEHVTGASNVISVGIDAFIGTSWYHNQPYGLLYVGNLAYIYFDGSDEAGSDVSIKEGCSAISSQAFKDCREITSVIIPSTVRSIGFEAFANCQSLTSISIPEGVSWIGAHSFSGCTSLSMLSLPSTLKMIGIMAFQDCGNIQTIYVHNNKPPKIKYSFANIEKESRIVYVPKGAQSTYLKTEWWRKFKNIIELDEDFEIQPEPVKETVSLPIKEKEAESTTTYSLFGEEITLPVYSEKGIENESQAKGRIEAEEKTVFTVDGISYMMDEEGTSVIVAEQEVESLMGNLILPPFIEYNGLIYPVTSIGRSAFQGYESLLSVEIPEGITLINGHAFACCTSLQTVRIPQSVTSIRGNAFSGCKHLTSIIIPSNVTWIGEMVFSNCSALTSVVIPEGVTTIDKSLFLECSSLIFVSIPSTVRSVDASAFEGCVSLLEIHLLTSEPPMVDTDWLFLDDFTFGTLYVPTGSAAAYKNAQWWRRFKQIEEETTLQRVFANVSEKGTPLFTAGDKKEETLLFTADDSKEETPTAYVTEESVEVEPSSFVTEVPSLRDEETEYPPTEASCQERSDVYQTITYEGLRYIINESNLTAFVAEQYGDTIPDDLIIPSEVIWNDQKYQVRVLLASAFMGCSTLKSVVISRGVSVIRDKSFAGCRSLTTIVLPETIQTIDLNVFIRCSELKRVFIQSVHPPFVDARSSLVEGISSCVLYVPNGSKQEYSETKWSKEFAFIQEKEYHSDSVQTPQPERVKISFSPQLASNQAVEIKVLKENDQPFVVPTTDEDSNLNECTIVDSFELPAQQAIELPKDDYTEPANIQPTDIAPLEIETSDDESSVSESKEQGILNRIVASVSKRIEPIRKKDTASSAQVSTQEKLAEKQIIVFDGLRYAIDERDMYVSVYAQDSATIAGDLIIPSEVLYLGKTYPVASIAGSAFKSCTNLATVKIEEGVSIIGSQAFSGCVCLTSITFPSTLNLIGEKLFKGCRRLTEVTIQSDEPPTVDSIDSILDDASFCTLIVPQGCKSAYSRKKWSRSFMSVTDSYSVVEQIARSSVKKSERRERKTEFPSNGLNYLIDEEGNSVTLSQQDKNAVSGTIIIPSEVLYNGSSYSVESIASGAFKGCNNLISVTISSGISIIGDEAFHSCSRLNNVTIPSSVRIIGDDSFVGCRRLEMMTIQNNLPPTVVSRRSILDEGALCTLYVPSGCKIVYSKTKWCSNFLAIEEEGNADEASAITLPEEQQSPGNQEMFIPEEESNTFLIDGLRYIKNEDSLTVSVSDQEPDMISGDIIIPPVIKYRRVEYPVNTISSSAFKGCTDLKSVTISSGVRIIRADAFSGCSSLSSITIPATVRIIGFNAFFGCKELQRMYIQGIDPPAVVAHSSIVDEGSYCVLYVPEESKPLYVRTKWCNGFKNILEMRMVEEQDNNSFQKILSEKTKGAQSESNVTNRGETNVSFSERIKNLFDK